MGEARSLVAAVSWLSLGNVLSRSVALITMPILTRWLSPEAYGEAALVSTVVSLATVLALAGIDVGYARHYFSDSVGSCEAVEAFCWRWTVGMTLLVGLVTGLGWLFGLAEWLGATPSSVGFVALGIVASGLATMAQTRARLQSRYARISQAQLLTGWAAAGIAIGIAYWYRRDAWPLLLAMMAGFVLPLLLLGLPATASLTKPSGLSRRQCRQLVGVGLAAVITAPAYWVVSSSDRWFLARYFDSAEVGIYSISYTVGTVGMAISSAITAAWLPELARVEATSTSTLARRKGELSQLLVAALIVVWMAVVAAGGDLIRLLANERFFQATTAVPWLAAGVLFYGVMHVGCTQLVLIGKMHWAAWIWGLALLVSIALNFWLVPLLGRLGASITQGVIFLLTMVLTWLVVLQFERIAIQWHRLVMATGVGAVCGLATYPQWGESPWQSMVFKLPVGILTAFLCFELLAPGLWRRAIGKGAA